MLIALETVFISLMDYLLVSSYQRQSDPEFPPVAMNCIFNEATCFERLFGFSFTQDHN